MAFKADAFRAGQPLTARDLNWFFAELERLGKVHAAAPLTVGEDAGGIRFALAGTATWWVRLTANSGSSYAWTRVVGDPASPGDWIDSPGDEEGTTSSDPAIEAGGRDDIELDPPPVFRAWRDPTSNALLFSAGGC